MSIANPLAPPGDGTGAAPAPVPGAGDRTGPESAPGPRAAAPTGGAGARLATVDGGYGLTGMRERLLLLGGTLTAGCADGRSWTVTARMPR